MVNENNVPIKKFNIEVRVPSGDFCSAAFLNEEGNAVNVHGCDFISRVVTITGEKYFSCMIFDKRIKTQLSPLSFIRLKECKQKTGEL